MKRRSRFLAGLLSAAMVMTNFSAPVMAAEQKEDISDLAQTVDAAVEPAETVESPGAKDVILDAPGEEDSVPAVGDGGEYVNGMIGDPAKGDTLISVRNYPELVKAIEGAQSGVQVTIEVNEPYDEENDDDYTISANAAVTIPSGKDIKLKVYAGSFLVFDEEEVSVLNAEGAGRDKFPHAFLTVESGAKLDIVCQDDSHTDVNIVNKGEFTVNEDGGLFSIEPFNGIAFTNEQGASAKLLGADFYSLDGESAAIVNNGTMVTDYILAYAKEASAPGADRFSLINRGDLLAEESDLVDPDLYSEVKDGETVYRYGYAVLNDKDAKMIVRGPGYIDSIYNNGTLTVGSENEEKTSVSRIYAFNGSSTVIHNADINLVDMAADKAHKALIKSGTLTQLGGSIISVHFSDVLPVLDKGVVYDLVHEVFDAEKKEVVKDEDPTALYFRGYTVEGPALVEKKPAFCVYDEKKDRNGYNAEYKGVRYIVADKIVNGVPYYNGAILDIDKVPAHVVKVEENRLYPLSSVDELKKIAVSENTAIGYYLTQDIEITEPITFTSPNVYIVGEYYPFDEEGNPLLDEDENEIAYYGRFVFSGAGSFAVEENAMVDLMDVEAVSIQKDKAATNVLFTNKGTLFTGDVTVACTTKPVVQNSGVYYSEYDIIASEAAATLIVNEENASAYICEDIYNSNARASMIENAGEMTIFTDSEDDYINLLKQEPATDEEGKDVTNVTAIKNSGIMTMTGVAVEGHVEDSVVIDNLGTLSLYGTDGEANYEGSLSIEGDAKGTTAILNNGSKASFVMNGGSVKAYKYDEVNEKDKAVSYAIVYTDNEPVLIRGRVDGTRSTMNHVLHKYDADGNATEELEAAVCGSAVAKKDGTTGSFKESEAQGALSIDSMNAGVIEEGRIPYTTTVKVNDGYGYLLMEKGESVVYSSSNDLEEEAAFALTLKNNTFGVSVDDMFEFISNDPGVADVKEVTAAVYDPDNYNAEKNRDLMDTKVRVIEAAGTGMATIKVRSRLSGNEDYLVIESVAKGLREKLMADSYEVNLATPFINMNALQKRAVVGVDWHIKDYENATGAYDLSNNFYPTGVVIRGADGETDDDFYKYFDVKQDLLKDGTTKTYFIGLETKTTGLQGDNTLLSQDGVTRLENLNVALVVKNRVSKKTFEVNANQKLGFRIDQKLPTIKLAKGFVNSAYTESYDLDNPSVIDLNDIMINQDDWGRISGITLTDDVKDFESIDNTHLTYTGNAKGGSYKVPMWIRLEEYHGKYYSLFNVRARAVYPKVSLVNKKATVIPEAGDYTNIDVFVKPGKNACDLEAIKDAEILDNDKFGIRKVGQDHFELIPRARIEKSEKVTIRINYEGLKKNKGKTYATLLKFTVKAVDPSKLKITKPYAEPLYVRFNEIKEGDATTTAVETTKCARLDWGISPVNVDITNIYYVVTALNGNAYVTSSDEYDENTYFDGVTSGSEVYVYATDGLSSNDKFVSVRISMYDSADTKIGKDVVARIPVNSGECKVNEPKPVTLDLTKQSDFNGSILTKAKGNVRIIGPDNTLVYNRYFPRAVGANEELENLLKVFTVNGTPLKAENGAILTDVDFKGSPYFYIVSDSGKLYAVTDFDALAQGLIKPGSSYTFDLYFDSPNGNMVVPFTINIADIRSVKASGVAFTYLSGITSYARTPIGIRTESPYYGLKIQSVTCDSPQFEISPFTEFEPFDEENPEFDADETSSTTATGLGITVPNYNDMYTHPDHYNYYFLSWKDNKLQGVKEGAVKVNLTVTYTCGVTAKVTVPLYVYGSPAR